MKFQRFFQILLLGGLFALSFLLNLRNNHFRLGFHMDEPVKVQSILSGQHKFEHPMLLLDVVKVANHFINYTNPQQIAVLGRSCMALTGALAVLMCYFLFRVRTGFGDAFIVCLGISVSPILVIHAHYLKEDILLMAGCIACLGSFLRWVEKPSFAWTLFSGTSTGLAFSAHYKSGLLMIFYILAPFFIPSLDKRRYFKHMLVCLVLALGIFGFLNQDIFDNLSVFVSGSAHEFQHAIKGHDVNIYALPSLLCFHLIKSLIPGMTFLVMALALFFLGGELRYWKKWDWSDRLFTLYILIFYLAVEISPLKPFPDFMRYVIPIVPVLVFFSYKGLLQFCKKFQLRKSIQILFIAAWILIPFSVTCRLVHYLNKDTRDEAIQWVMRQKLPAVYESSAGFLPYVKTVADLNLDEERKRGIAYFVASSFKYDRFFLPHLLIQKDEKNHARKQQYKRLFKDYPVMEFKPRFKSFAFSNPTIRVIDIRREKTNSVQTEAS